MQIRVTNKLNFPEPIVRAVANDPYDPGQCDYSITGLLNPPRLYRLYRDNTIVEDVSDRIYSLQGQAIHIILERAAKELGEQGYIVEKRFKSTFVVSDRIFTVSSQIDIFDPVSGILSDYKNTSVGSIKCGLKEEYKWQVNFQAEMLRRQGFKVEGAHIVAFLRDWSAEKVYEDYPKKSVIEQQVPLLSSEEVDKWVKDRIKLHEDAKKNLPKCTDEDRWQRPKYAVMKTQWDKRAKRVFENRSDAEKYILDNDKNLIIVKRDGESIRCLRYCPVRFICEQAKQYRPEVVVDNDGFIKL